MPHMKNNLRKTGGKWHKPNEKHNMLWAQWESLRFIGEKGKEKKQKQEYNIVTEKLHISIIEFNKMSQCIR